MVFRKLNSLIFTLILAAGFANGTPLSAAKALTAGENFCKMKCCKEKVHSHETGANNVCAIMGCEESLPSMPGSSGNVDIAPKDNVRLSVRFAPDVSKRPFTVKIDTSLSGKPDLANPPPKFLLNKTILV